MPGNFLNHVHGYHCACYQKFTNISNVSKSEGSTEDLPQPHLKRRRSDSNLLFPSDRCLFCNKNRKKEERKGRTTKCVTSHASDLIKEKALSKHDYDVQAKVNETDLVAKQAHYHRTCYRLFAHDVDRNTTQARGDEDAKENIEAHGSCI